jgi:hypothetical protein
LFYHWRIAGQPNRIKRPSGLDQRRAIEKTKGRPGAARSANESQ